MSNCDWDRAHRQERQRHEDTTPPIVREQRRHLYDAANTLLRQSTPDRSQPDRASTTRTR